MASKILDHTGLLNYSSIDTLLAQFKYVSQERDIRFQVYKRIITVMIESLENVWKYRDLYEDFVTERQEYLPTFSIAMNAESIRLKTSNPVRNKDIDVLKRKIDVVNNKDREALKELYVQTITNGKFSDKGGAGLGFIEMAKTSGHNLEYTFEPINEEYSLYTFEVTFSL